MRLIDADVFLKYLIFSKHIDSLKCREVKEAVEMSKVDVLDKIRAEIEDLRFGQPLRKLVVDECLEIIDKYKGEGEDKDADSN